MELSYEAHLQIVNFIVKGSEFRSKFLFKEALGIYYSGLKLIPELKADYDENTWLETEIGNCYFEFQDFHKAVLHYQSALISEDGIDDAFIWFKLGCSFYLLNDMDNAIVHLKQSFTLEGDEFFTDEDPKYLLVIGQHPIEKKINVFHLQESNTINYQLPPDWKKN
ncbi:hypothetical protein GJU39_22160 [Pedobacter petrophilus]|uniref:Tetratricopeptide repeat protein n=1 Tax=Pedobacter petrophilus TaxID=1908241 RepID=A0A7K0G607_9SPHI|nr:hypothetical protein [Pedobacter petrophilus]MRX78784.1 hypothetical protein [Pedobacter petrophilus]